MKFSINWLAEYVDLTDITPQELADTLTSAGIEVVSLTPMAVATNLVIGQIKEVKKHPNAETLTVLQVDQGPKYGRAQIVCGAPNVREGLKVIVARPGAELANDFKIASTELRGVESNGMVCALNELGVDPKYLRPDQIAGIEELNDDAEVGREDVLSYLHLDDTIIELDLLANRPDASALAYLALEVQSLFKRKKALPQPKIKQTFVSQVTVNSKTEKCPQFSLREVRNIKNGDSPQWLKARLIASGIRPVNLIVDIGNYVMLLTGQPLHLYDADKLASKEFIVRDDFDVKEFRALDDELYHVLPGDIVISVNDQIMCLGGVMGALDCAIDDHTANIVIEVANFDSATIRTTAIRLGLISDSSQRFAKGINPHQADFVLDIAAALLAELGETQAISQIVSYDQVDHRPQIIKASFKEINERLGTNFTKLEITNALNALNIAVDQLDEEVFNATIPPYRIDFSSSADLSEEVIRLLGYEHIEVKLPTSEMSLGRRSEAASKTKLIRDYLLNLGFYEALTYSLISKEEQERFAYLLKGTPYTILNPLTPEHETMRLNTLSSLINVARYNYARQLTDFKLFEISDTSAEGEIIQQQLSVVLVGEQLEQGKLRKTPFSFYHVKGILEGLLSLLGIAESRLKFERFNDQLGELHPGRSMAVYAGKNLIGVLGELHPNIRNEYDFAKTPVAVLTINLSALFALKTSTIKAVGIAKFPVVNRDLAVVVDANVAVGELINTIRRSAKKILKDVEVFDIYVGEHVGPQQKSVAFSLTYGDETKTLTDHEISLAEENIMAELYRRFNASRRK